MTWQPHNPHWAFCRVPEQIIDQPISTQGNCLTRTVSLEPGAPSAGQGKRTRRTTLWWAQKRLVSHGLYATQELHCTCDAVITVRKSKGPGSGRVARSSYALTEPPVYRAPCVSPGPSLGSTLNIASRSWTPAAAPVSSAGRLLCLADAVSAVGLCEDAWAKAPLVRLIANRNVARRGQIRGVGQATIFPLLSLDMCPAGSTLIGPSP